MLAPYGRSQKKLKNPQAPAETYHSLRQAYKAFQARY